MPDIDLSFLPLDTKSRRALTDAFSELINEAGDTLESLILFGSAASDEFDPDQSDLNLLVVLRRDDRDALELMGPPLAKLMRRHKVSPMITTGEELKTSADVFPVKFLNIRERHRMLFGPDPFTAMQIRQVHLRLRCEQELKNMSLKLRRSLIARAATSTARRDMIRSFLPPFATVLRTMLGLAGERVPKGRREVLEAAADAFDLPREQLGQLAKVGWGEVDDLEEEALEALSHAFLRVVATAAAVADRMPESSDSPS